MLIVFIEEDVVVLLLDLVAFEALPPLKDAIEVVVATLAVLLVIVSAAILVGVDIAASLEL